MINAIKNLFKPRRSTVDRLIDIIEQQNAYIAKNIQERVVYVDPQTGYTNMSRFDDPVVKDTTVEEANEIDDEFDIDDCLPEELERAFEEGAEK
jgi:hypothetical protein